MIESVKLVFRNTFRRENRPAPVMRPRTDPNLVQAQVWARRIFFLTRTTSLGPQETCQLPWLYCTQPIHKTLWHTRVTVPLESYRVRKPWVQVPSTPLLQFLLCLNNFFAHCFLNNFLRPFSLGREFGAARGHLVGRACHSMTPSHRIHNVLSVYISALSINCTRKFEIGIMWFPWSNLT